MKKKKVIITISILLIVIGLCLIVCYLYFLFRNKENKDKGEKFLDEMILDEDDKYVYIDGDFLKELQEYFNNEDVIGYIVYEEAGISYPVVHSKDNKEYLKLGINGSYSGFGTIFLDKNCKGDFSSVNSVLYGHHMRDGSMFGSLQKRVDSVGVKDEVFYMYTRDGRKEYKAISAEVIEDTKDNAQKLVLGDREEFIEWLKGISHDYILEEEDGNFMTLISCYYTGFSVERYGLTGVEVGEKEYRVKED